MGCSDRNILCIVKNAEEKMIFVKNFFLCVVELWLVLLFLLPWELNLMSVGQHEC